MCERLHSFLDFIHIIFAEQQTTRTFISVSAKQSFNQARVALAVGGPIIIAADCFPLVDLKLVAAAVEMDEAASMTFDAIVVVEEEEEEIAAAIRARAAAAVAAAAAAAEAEVLLRLLKNPADEEEEEEEEIDEEDDSDKGDDDDADDDETDADEPSCF